MGKMQEIADELKKKFSEINKKGGWLSAATFVLYKPNSEIDSLVNKHMNLTDKDFLFYYCYGDGRISFTDTHLYFSGKSDAYHQDIGQSTIKPVSMDEKSYGARRPIFKIDIEKLAGIELTGLGKYTILPATIYLLSLKFTDDSEEIVPTVWHDIYEEKYTTVIKLVSDIVCKDNMIKLIKTKEKNLDYSRAIDLWEDIGKPKEAGRVRKLMAEQGSIKVDQTVVHGDYVDDRDTIIKDSVLNRSNVGAGGKTKGERIKLIKDLLDSGAIDDDEFKQMKKEILEK